MYIYLIVINILTFLTFGIDKKKAILNEKRVSENTLLIICFLGGILGGLLGMMIFHHKTRKLKFLIIMPLIMLIWIIFLLELF